MIASIIIDTGNEQREELLVSSLWAGDLIAPAVTSGVVIDPSGHWEIRIKCLFDV